MPLAATATTSDIIIGLGCPTRDERKQLPLHATVDKNNQLCHIPKKWQLVILDWDKAASHGRSARSGSHQVKSHEDKTQKKVGYKKQWGCCQFRIQVSLTRLGPLLTPSMVDWSIVDHRYKFKFKYWYVYIYFMMN